MTAPVRALVFYEVHYWPTIGRVLVIDQPAHRDTPRLIDLDVEAYPGELAEATALIAHQLGAAAQFDRPDPMVVTHDAHGNILGTPAGLGTPVVVLRRAPQ